MNKLLTDNLPWKIASLILASLFWIFVINTQNPIQPQEIRDIPVIIKGLDELEKQGFILKNEDEIKNQKFKVVIKGPRLETDKILNDKTLITATLDLTKYMGDMTQDSIRNTANYEVKILLENNSISVTDKTPGVSTIIFEREATVTKQIEYALSDEFKNKYTLLDEPIVSPRTIELKGAKSDIESVNKVVVNIDEANFSEEELVQTVPVKIYDIDGNEIETLTMEPENAQVRLLIGKPKTVPIEVSFIGNVPSGYVHTNTFISPTEVTIVGKAETVDAISKIKLKPINLDNQIQTTLLTTEMILPKGITTKIENEISVTLEIVKENTYSYIIPTEKLNLDIIGLDDTLVYEILTDEVDITLSATAEELLAYNASQIQTKLDLTGLTEGEYTLPLEVIVPENFKVLNTPVNLNIKLSKVEQAPPLATEVPEDEVVEGEP